ILPRGSGLLVILKVEFISSSTMPGDFPDAGIDIPKRIPRQINLIIFFLNFFPAHKITSINCFPTGRWGNNNLTGLILYNVRAMPEVAWNGMREMRGHEWSGAL